MGPEELQAGGAATTATEASRGAGFARRPSRPRRAMGLGGGRSNASARGALCATPSEEERRARERAELASVRRRRPSPVALREREYTLSLLRASARVTSGRALRWRLRAGGGSRQPVRSAFPAGRRVSRAIPGRAPIQAIDMGRAALGRAPIYTIDMGRATPAGAPVRRLGVVHAELVRRALQVPRVSLRTASTASETGLYHGVLGNWPGCRRITGNICATSA